jgi:hypothetical protein
LQDTAPVRVVKGWRCRMGSLSRDLYTCETV